MKTSISKHSQLTPNFKAICLNFDLTSHHIHKNSHFLHKKNDSHFMNVYVHFETFVNQDLLQYFILLILIEHISILFVPS
jgi:hypothetical protein